MQYVRRALNTRAQHARPFCRTSQHELGSKSIFGGLASPRWRGASNLRYMSHSPPPPPFLFCSFCTTIVLQNIRLEMKRREEKRRRELALPCLGFSVHYTVQRTLDYYPPPPPELTRSNDSWKFKYKPCKHFSSLFTLVDVDTLWRLLRGFLLLLLFLTTTWGGSFIRVAFFKGRWSENIWVMSNVTFLPLLLQIVYVTRDRNVVRKG